MSIDFAAVVDSAPDAVVIVGTASGEIRYVNSQVTALFGYQPEALVGQPIEVLVPLRYRADHVIHRQGYARSPSTRPMGTGLKLSAVRQDGSEFPVDISLATIEAPEGPLTIAFIRDVSDRFRVDTLTRDLTVEVGGLRHAVTDLGKAKASPYVVVLLVALLAAQVFTAWLAR